MSHTYLDLLHLLQGLRYHAQLQSDQRDIPLDSGGSLVHDAVVVFKDGLGLSQTFQRILKLSCLLLHLREGDRDVRQELRVGVLFELGERLQCLTLELDGFFDVFFTVMHSCDLNVTVAHLFRLSAESHLVELPGFAKDV